VNRVGLQEYFEKILEFRFGAFDKIIEARFTAMEKATQLAARLDNDLQRERAMEMARRLDELNHAHAQATVDKAAYLPRETHSADLKELNTRIAALEKIAAVAVFLAVALPIALNYFRWFRP